MITSLRNSLKDGGMTTIVWVAVGSMIIGSALPLIMKKGSSEWALRVNGTDIPYATYAAELAMVRDYITMLRAQYGQFADYLLQSMGFSDPQQMTMQQLITQSLMVYGYKAQGIVVSQEAIAQKLADKKFVDESLGDLLPSFLYKDGIVDNTILKHYLSQRSMTIEQLQERIHERIGTVFMHNAIELLAYVPNQSISDSLALQNAIKELALVRIPLSHYKKKVSAEITDEQVKAFYEQENARAHRYYIPEKRAGSVWEFDAQGFGTNVDAAAIERYYEEHKTTRYQKEPAQITVRALGFATRDSADSVRALIIDGANTVSALAKEYPFSQEAAADSGLLKPIVRGAGDRVIEKAAFILANDGDLSPVIAHNDRFILLQRVSKTPAVIIPLSKVQNEIKEQLQQTEFKNACLRELSELARTNNTDAIAAFAKERKAKKSQIQSIALADAKTEAQKNLFALEHGAYSAVNAGNQCLLVHLDEVVPAAVQAYDVAMTTVRNDLIEYRAKQALSQAYLDFSHAVATQGIQSTAREYGFTVTPYTYKGATDTAQVTELRTKYGLDERTLNPLQKVGTLAMAEHDGDVVIAALIDIKQSDTATPDSQMAQVLAKKDSQTLVAGYIASLYRDATIEKNDILALLDKENTI